MFRPLHPLDAARHALLGGPGGNNRVYTLDGLGRDPGRRLSMVEVARLSLEPPARGACSWVWTEGTRLKGIAAARRRSGPRSWELSHLAVDSDDDPGCADLLAQVCRSVAQRGGERVFMRLATEDPLASVARRSGFIPCRTELLYRGRRRAFPTDRSAVLRRKTQADDYGLFRLYNASTPAETRFAIGVTFDQWASSRERTRWRGREFVYEREGQLRGSVKAIQRFRSGQLLIGIHPDDESSLGALVEYGLARLSWVSTVFCVVPDYQVTLQRLLPLRGFEPVSGYVTLVKSMVTPVRTQKARRAATIAST